MFHTVKLSKTDPTPIYIQLACELSKLIEQGILYGGMKLPTIRFLSNQLSINRDTVVSAYKLLEKQGLVESHIGRGTYIAEKKPSLTLSSPTIPASNTTQFCCSQLTPSEQFFPNNLCLELTTQIAQKECWEAFSDPLYRERNALKQSVTQFLETLGIKAHFAQTRIVSQMEHFWMDLLKLSPKTGICVETPRDLTVSCYLRSLGSKVYEVPLTSFGMDLDLLEKYLRTGNISYIFINPYLQNPTGICYSKECMEKLLDLAKCYDCYIVEDGTYCDFLLSRHYHPLFNLSSEGRVIYLYHFSKVYLPYMKYSFVCLPLSLIKRIHDEIDCSFNERFLHYYLDSASLQEIKQHMLLCIKERYTYLLEKIAPLSPAITYKNSWGGLFLWCKVSEKHYEAFLNKLLQKEVIIAPEELFTYAPPAGHFRISISNVSLAQIDEIAQSFLESIPF